MKKLTNYLPHWKNLMAAAITVSIISLVIFAANSAFDNPTRSIQSAVCKIVPVDVGCGLNSVMTPADRDRLLGN